MITKCVKIGDRLLNIENSTLFEPPEQADLIEFEEGTILYSGNISLKEIAGASIDIHSYIITARCQKIKDNLENLMTYAPYIMQLKECSERNASPSLRNCEDGYTESIIKATDAVLWLIKRKNVAHALQDVDLKDIFIEISQILAINVVCDSKYKIYIARDIFKAAIMDIIIFCNIRNIYISAEELDPDIETSKAKICISLFGEFHVKDIAAIAPSCCGLEKCGFIINIIEKNINVYLLI